MMRPNVIQNGGQDAGQELVHTPAQATRPEHDLRSLLFVPADAPQRLMRAVHSGADAIILDLEDMVAPEHKQKARAAAAEFLHDRNKSEDGPRIMVRVNGLETGMMDADLDAIMPAAPFGIMLPKSRSGMDVQHLAAKLAVREAQHDLRDGSTLVLPLVTESGAAVFGLPTYPRASHRLAGLVWGVEDLCADIGAEDARNENGDWAAPFALVRNLTLFAAAAAIVPAIDTIFRDFGDSNGLRQEAQRAQADGFSAKMAIHPDQVETINQIFTPTGEMLARAQAIVAAFSAHADARHVSIEGRLYDRTHLARARRTIARAAHI